MGFQASGEYCRKSPTTSGIYALRVICMAYLLRVHRTGPTHRPGRPISQTGCTGSLFSLGDEGGERHQKRAGGEGARAHDLRSNAWTHWSHLACSSTDTALACGKGSASSRPGITADERARWACKERAASTASVKF
eukprot:6187267-Pleurochrysis_carterae.AAC.3